MTNRHGSEKLSEHEDQSTEADVGEHYLMTTESDEKSNLSKKGRG